MFCLEPNQSYCCHPHFVADNRLESVWVIDFSSLLLLFPTMNLTLNDWNMMHPIRDLGDGKMNKIQSLSLGNQAVMFVYFLSSNTLQRSLYFSLKKKKTKENCSLDLSQVPGEQPEVMCSNESGIQGTMTLVWTLYL